MSTLSTIINELSRELTKEINRELTRTDVDSFTKFEIEKFFDRAARVVATREIDRIRRSVTYAKPETTKKEN